MGDFNTCLINADKLHTTRASKLRYLINSVNLHILPLNPTHLSPNCTPSLLDLMIVSSPDHISTHGQFNAEAFSYHDLIFLSYKIRYPKPKPRTVLQRNFNGIDSAKLMEDLRAINWDLIYSAPTVDEKMDLFNTLLMRVFDRHAPLRPVRLKHLPAPWLSDDIKSVMAKRNAAKIKFRMNPNDQNHERYKVLRNKCNRLCRDAQRRYIHSSVSNGDPAKVWSFLNSLGIGKAKSSPLPNIDLDTLNRHLTTTTSIPTSVKQQSINALLLSPTPDPPLSPFIFKTLTIQEVEKTIISIKSNAEGVDGISRKMIVLSSPIVLPVLCHIYNSSLNSSTFPCCWRKAAVIPIPKVKCPTLPTHFRPISILPFLSKVLERLVYQQLSCFINFNGLLSPLQSGFRPGHSTVTALTRVSDDVRLAMSNQQLTVLALLDFSNAFNTVDYDILIAMLRALHFSDPVLEWFHSYLFGRQQCIRTSDRVSVFCDIVAGVPQGGVLSPLLFSLFINFLTPLLDSLFHLYADDLQIYTHASPDDLKSAFSLINKDLATILDWSQRHGLMVNPNKSQIIVIGGTKQINRPNYDTLPIITFDNVPLNCSDVVKNLGVFFDSTLRWSHHISEVSRKLFAAVGSLNRWKNLLPVKTKVELAQTLLLPILDYADVCLIDLNEEYLNKLERLQNICIRFVYGLRKFDHISEYRQKLGWLPIRLRREEHVLVLLYNILHDPRSPPYLKNCFKYRSAEQSRVLRSEYCKKLLVPFTRSGYYANSFAVKASHLWNALSHEIRESRSLATFKSKLHIHLQKRVSC